MEIEEYKSEISSLNINILREQLKAPSNATYEWYLNASRSILKNMVCQQAVLGFYATKVCTIRHGGISGDHYTIKRFAEDLGLNPKTLNEWTAVYRRVIQHLDIDPINITPKEWRSARRIAYQIEGETRKKNIQSGRPKAKGDYAVKKEDIKKLWQENLDGPSVLYEVREWSSKLRTLHSNLEKRDLKLADPFDLLEVMTNADLVSDLINDFLTKQKKDKK